MIPLAHASSIRAWPALICVMLFPPHMRPCGGLLPAPECPPRGKPRAELLADWSPGAAKPVNSALNGSAFQFCDYAGRECSSPLGEGSARPAHGSRRQQHYFCDRNLRRQKSNDSGAPLAAPHDHVDATRLPEILHEALAVSAPLVVALPRRVAARSPIVDPHLAPGRSAITSSCRGVGFDGAPTSVPSWA